MAHVGAILDLPFVANCLSFDVAGAADPWQITRVRWGGSLLEQCELSATTKLVTIVHHAIETGGDDRRW